MKAQIRSVDDDRDTSPLAGKTSRVWGTINTDVGHCGLTIRGSCCEETNQTAGNMVNRYLTVTLTPEEVEQIVLTAAEGDLLPWLAELVAAKQTLEGVISHLQHGKATSNVR